MKAYWVAMTVSAAAVVLALAWFLYPVSVPQDVYVVEGMEYAEIRSLKEQLAAADVSENSEARGWKTSAGVYLLECGHFPVASVWDDDTGTQIVILPGAEKRFPRAGPAIAALRRSVQRHGGRQVVRADFEFSKLDKLLLKYRSGEDADARC